MLLFMLLFVLFSSYFWRRVCRVPFTLSRSAVLRSTKGPDSCAELLKQCKLLLLIYFNYLIYGYLIFFSLIVFLSLCPIWRGVLHRCD